MRTDFFDGNIVQENKRKLRPLMDYRELNNFVDAYTANAGMVTARE